MTFLEPTERVEADDGYIAESSYKTKCPGAVLAHSGEEEDAMHKRVQGRHEMVNASMKFLQSLQFYSIMTLRSTGMYFVLLPVLFN